VKTKQSLFQAPSEDVSGGIDKLLSPNERMYGVVDKRAQRRKGIFGELELPEPSEVTQASITKPEYEVIRMIWFRNKSYKDAGLEKQNVSIRHVRM
jgi:hypothetical protein